MLCRRKYNRTQSEKLVVLDWGIRGLNGSKNLKLPVKVRQCRDPNMMMTISDTRHSGRQTLQENLTRRHHPTCKIPDYPPETASIARYCWSCSATSYSQ
ncbi:transmembrane protein 171 isoform X2 [Rhinatrema bivittatum]|uniref:transmembrane protein 171 isoform X2 n=1 Tax=Rhinatrema bivittatum TaxID=194408 RepID=UPI00112B8CCC|nr:transmembrane protein 171 isoform X2 [Rhinatrema bivittatum]